MVTISPSILACDFLNIEPELKPFESVKDFWFHLDIMDGHFVPNLTIGHPVIKLLRKITNHKLDAHFMVTNPEFYMETFKDYDIHNFTFHIEAIEDSLSLIKKAKEIYPSVGISIKPNTDVSAIGDDILKEIDLLLVMSVEPGFGGQKFIENTYDKLKEIQQRKAELGINFSVQIDGGVNEENAKKLISHGADNLVAGSFIFKSNPQNYSSNVEKLR